MKLCRNAILFVASLLIGGRDSDATGASPQLAYLIETEQIEQSLDSFEGALVPAITEAPKRLQKLIQSQPHLAPAYAAAVHYLLFVGSKDGWPGFGTNGSNAANALLDAAQNADADYCESFWLRAQLLIASGKAESAWQPIRRARLLACSDPLIDVVSARVSNAQGDVAAAERDLLRVLSRGPGPDSRSSLAFSTATTDYGSLLYALHRFDDLRRHIDRWEKSGQVFATWTNVNAARQLLLIGDFEHSQHLSQTTLTVLDLPAARMQRGIALYGLAWAEEISQRNPATAASALTMAQEYLPDESVAATTLAVAPCCQSSAWKTLLARHVKGETKADASPSDHQSAKVGVPPKDKVSQE